MFRCSIASWSSRTTSFRPSCGAGGAWTRREFRTHEQTGFPLTVAATLGTELAVRICSDESRFDGPAVKRMAGHLRTLVEQILEDPGRRLSKLAMLTAAERRQLLVDWNDTRADYPRDRLIHELFEQQAELTPDAIALAGESEETSYRETSARADAVADALRRLGTAPEEPVGLWGSGSLDAIVGMLGIFKAGAAYVPLPVDAPHVRIRAILSDAGIRRVVRCALPPWPVECGPVRLLDLNGLPGLRARTEAVSRLSQSGQSLPEQGLPRKTPDALHEDLAIARTPPVFRADLACIIYTSGTTGEPRGACVRHRGLVNLLTFRTRVQFRPGDFRVAPLTAPIHFDASLVQIFSPLITGGTLVLARTPDELTASPWYARLTALTGALA